MKFNEWFTNKLRVQCWPAPEDITEDVRYVINVSDEYDTEAQQQGTRYFWFPMNECFGDMGFNSLFGALSVLYAAEKENAKVILHCHAGANRSPTVMEAYYFMRTGRHLPRKTPTQIIYAEEQGYGNNRLLNNIDRGVLPSRYKTEKFLKELGKALEKDGEPSLDVLKNPAKIFV